MCSFKAICSYAPYSGAGKSRKQSVPMQDPRVLERHITGAIQCNILWQNRFMNTVFQCNILGQDMVIAGVFQCNILGQNRFMNTVGPILHPAQFSFYTDACVVASLQLARSGLFPPQARVAKLGNDLAPRGAVCKKEEACSGANVPWCYFAVSENNSATNQEITWFKVSGALFRC